MSQKSTRRARRQTTEEEPTSFKAPKTSDADVTSTEESQEIIATLEPQEAAEQNGTETNEAENCIITRSRSATPQVKKTTTQNGHEEVGDEIPINQDVEPEPEEAKPVEENDLNVSAKAAEHTDTEMDPLIVSDEPDPELQFEDNSDLESGKSSPVVISRCKTRRSQSRNVATPKTPKEEVVVDSASKEEQDLNASFESCTDDMSTQAEAGSDSTRLNYTDKELSNTENNSFLQGAKGKSFGETLRCLSTRRTIRPISEDYRKRLLKTNLNKTDFDTSYPSRNSVERVSLKRKVSEVDEAIRKRFKGESPGFFSRLTSPLSSIRNTFRSDIPTSTPKLTGYKDEKFLLEDDGINSQMCEVNSDGERRWCSIM